MTDSGTLRAELAELGRIMEILDTKSVSETVHEVEFLARLKTEYTQQAAQASGLFYAHIETLREILSTLPPHPDRDRMTSLDAVLHIMHAYKKLADTNTLLAAKSAAPRHEFNDHDRALLFLLADVLPERLGDQIHQGHVDRLRSIGETIAAQLAHADP